MNVYRVMPPQHLDFMVTEAQFAKKLRKLEDSFPFISEGYADFRQMAFNEAMRQGFTGEVDKGPFVSVILGSEGQQRYVLQFISDHEMWICTGVDLDGAL